MAWAVAVAEEGVCCSVASHLSRSHSQTEQKKKLTMKYEMTLRQLLK